MLYTVVDSVPCDVCKKMPNLISFEIEGKTFCEKCITNEQLDIRLEIKLKKKSLPPDKIQT